MVATINPIKDQNGYYCESFRKCVIIEVIENHLPIRQAVRYFWKTTSRREEALYTKTVRSWVNVFKKYGVYIMKDLNKIPLTREDFTPTEELLKIENVTDFDEACKLIKKLQMAVIHQNAVIGVYKEKVDLITPYINDILKKKSK